MCACARSEGVSGTDGRGRAAGALLLTDGRPARDLKGGRERRKRSHQPDAGLEHGSGRDGARAQAQAAVRWAWASADATSSRRTEPCRGGCGARGAGRPCRGRRGPPRRAVTGKEDMETGRVFWVSLSGRQGRGGDEGSEGPACRATYQDGVTGVETRPSLVDRREKIERQGLVRPDAVCRRLPVRREPADGLVERAQRLAPGRSCVRVVDDSRDGMCEPLGVRVLGEDERDALGHQRRGDGRFGVQGEVVEHGVERRSARHALAGLVPERAVQKENLERERSGLVVACSVRVRGCQAGSAGCATTEGTSACARSPTSQCRPAEPELAPRARRRLEDLDTPGSEQVKGVVARDRGRLRVLDVAGCGLVRADGSGRCRQQAPRWSPRRPDRRLDDSVLAAPWGVRRTPAVLGPGFRGRFAQDGPLGVSSSQTSSAATSVARARKADLRGPGDGPWPGRRARRLGRLGHDREVLASRSSRPRKRVRARRGEGRR